MDINKKIEELEKQRLDFISQAEKQVAFMDGQLALLREMKQEQENGKEGKEG